MGRNREVIDVLGLWPAASYITGEVDLEWSGGLALMGGPPEALQEAVGLPPS